MRSKIALSVVAALFLVALASGCTRFARTQNIPTKQNQRPENVVLYVDHLPDQPYEVIGIIEVKPMVRHLEGVYKHMRKRAAKEGADGVVRIRSTREYSAGADLRRGQFYFRTNQRFFGDAIVFTEAKFSSTEDYDE